MERHWNPAKEDQATARAWRIGSEKEVFVHYPILVHPTDGEEGYISFDENLAGLLEKKRSLAGDLGFSVVPDASSHEIGAGLFGNSAREAVGMTLGEVLRLDPMLFEAFVAECLSRESAEVWLGQGRGDGGVDVVAFGHGSSGANLLVQCKSTSNRRKKYNQEVEIRNFRGARPEFEEIHSTQFELRFIASHCGFGRAAKKAAKVEDGVDLCSVKWIQSKLRDHQITFGDVLPWTSKRRNCRRPG